MNARQTGVTRIRIRGLLVTAAGQKYPAVRGRLAPPRLAKILSAVILLLISVAALIPSPTLIVHEG